MLLNASTKLLTKKRIFSFFIFTILCLFCIAPVNVMAADSWESAANTTWYSNEKSEFTLTTPEELAGLALLVNQGNNFTDKTITLGKSIDLSGRQWIPIGNAYKSFGDANTYFFNGIFNGGGNTIQGMTIGSTEAPYQNSMAGFFGLVSGIVKDLTFKDCIIHSQSSLYYTFDLGTSGVFCGVAAGANISNCHVINAAVAHTMTNSPALSGISCFAGFVNGATITNSTATGTIADQGTGKGRLGGFIGTLDTNAKVTLCRADVDITGIDKTTTAGGFLGFCGTKAVNTASEIIQCSAYGNLSDCIYGGGFAGSISYLKITDCYAAGAVTNTSYAGGFFSSGASSSNISTITNCYAAQPGGVYAFGGTMDGDTPRATVNNCYFIGTESQKKLQDGTVTAISSKNSVTQDFAKALNNNRETISWYQYNSVNKGLPQFSKYNTIIIDSAITNGTVTADQRLLKNGEAQTVTLTATANDGFSLKEGSLKVYKTEDSTVTVPVIGNQFTMPNYDVTITAEFVKRLTIRVSQTQGGSITPSGNTEIRYGEDQTFTITPDQGYKIKDVEVDGVSIGQVSSYTFSKVDANHSIAVSFQAVAPYTDVSDKDWFHQAAVYCYDKGYMTGIASKTFGGNAKVSRAMAVTVLYRMAGEPTVFGNAAFADVKNGMYYADAVLWAQGKAIAKGYDDGNFHPNDYISREEMAAFLCRYDNNAIQKDNKSLSRFKDYDDISHWALDSIQWAVNYSVMSGYTDNTLRPQWEISRAELAVMIMNYDK